MSKRGFKSESMGTEMKGVDFCRTTIQAEASGLIHPKHGESALTVVLCVGRHIHRHLLLLDDKYVGLGVEEIQLS